MPVRRNVLYKRGDDSRACAAHLTMPAPSKAVQQDGHLGEPSTYGYDAPTSFQRWALAGLCVILLSRKAFSILHAQLAVANAWDTAAAGSGAYTSLMNTISSKGSDQQATTVAKLASEHPTVTFESPSSLCDQAVDREQEHG